MKAIQRKHKKLVAASVLFTFVLAWVLPVQACFASSGTPWGVSVVECPNCSSPAGCDSASCGSSMAASCGAHQAPTVTGGQHHQNDIAFIPVLIGIAAPEVETSRVKPAVTPTVLYPTVSVNVRFCTYLK